MTSIEGDAWLGLAIPISGLVHHEYLLFAAHTREMPVVANTYQQTSAISISKGRNGFGKFTGISHAILEVLLLVLALANKAEKISLVGH